MAEAASQALQSLLTAERILESARPVGLAGLLMLLALKAGPASPHELAVALGTPSARVRQRLLRLRRRKATSALVRSLPDGRYRLSLKGHRFVNEVAAFAYHVNHTTAASQV